MNKKRLIQRLQKEEGLVLKPYVCPAGYVSIGYGRNLEANWLSKTEVYALLNNRKLEIREYSKFEILILLIKGISKSEACMLLANDAHNAIWQCEKNISYFEFLSHTTQEVLVDMCFNMGIGNLLGFKRMFKAIAIGDYKEASYELMDSKYARDKWTRSRAERNRDLLRGNSD